MKKRKRGTCTFCGIVDEVTMDHVFSRGLFPEKYVRSKNTLTVPACLKCNNGFSADEEHLRFFLVNIASEYSKEANDMLYSKIKRSIEKSPGKGHKILNTMELVNLRDSTGNFLGKKTKINISEEDWQRHHRVLDKYIKGLFFSLRGRVLPAHYRLEHYLAKPNDTFRKFSQTLINWNTDEKEVVVYANNFIPESDASIWLTIFYNQVAFQTFLVTDEQSAKFKKDLAS